MIPILYEKTETAFATNGLGRLRDCISCEVTEERNGIYELDFEYPITGANYNLIQLGRIVGVTHDDSGDIQPFDIVSYTKPIDGVVTFHCVHISYRQSYMTVTGSGINTLAAAFAQLGNATPTNPFTYETDKTSNGYVGAFDGVPKTVRSMLGGVEGSILDTYGGEYEWDRFTVRLHSARGQYRNFAIRYGVNMLDYEDETDMSETYSTCIPYWTDGTTTIVGDKQTSGGTPISGREQCIPLDVSEKFEDQPTKADVNAMGLAVMNSQNPTIPAQNITVSFVRLQDMSEYALYSNLLQCRLCDTIRVVFPDFNGSGDFKIVKTTWNVLENRYEEMELGDLSISLSEALGISNSGNRSGTYIEPDDYVSDTGASGDWKWRKWNSGRIEAWATHSFGSQTGTAWASQWYKDVTLALPSSLFTSVKVFATSNNSSWAVYGTSVSSGTITIRAVRNASNAANMSINFYCEGA